MLKKLAIITTHPIQYNAPWFRILAQNNIIQPKVFYTWSQSQQGPKYDPGFGKEVEWDIPLLDGYDYTFVNNTSAKPGSHHFKGIINPTLLKEVEEWKPLAILVFGWAFVSHLKCIRYFHKKIPVLFRGDSTLLRTQAGLKKALRKLFLKWVYSHIDYALYVGLQNRLYFEHAGLKVRQLVYAPHAIDNQRFSDRTGEVEKTASSWRTRLGIPTDKLTILYAGKLEEIKEPDFMLKMANKLKALPIQFVIVGNGPLEPALKAGTAGNKQFIFLDFQNQQNMPVVYRLADLFILTSKSETWGLSVNEAMACARGVLVRDTCGCAADLVANGENGYVFNAEDSGDLLHKLEGLVDDKQQWMGMGSRSLKKIEDYSFNHIVNAIESLMEKI